MKHIKKIVFYLFMFCLIVGCVSVTPADAAVKKVKASKVTLNKTSCVIKKGKSVKLKATVLPKKATAKTIIWSSSNKKIAVVDKKGKVTAKKNGKAKITAKVKNTKVKAVCDVTVGTPITSITVQEKNVSLSVGASHQIKTRILPKNASDKRVIYTSNNKKVVTVDAKGKIKAKAAGTAKIFVTAKSDAGKKVIIKVTVTKKRMVNSIALSADKKEIEVGEKLVLKANIKPSNASNKTLKFVSGNPQVASVTAKGVVTAKAAGTVSITASAQDGSGKKAAFKITVKKKSVLVTSIHLSAGQLEMSIGETSRLQPEVFPKDATNSKVLYESSDPETASVDEKGMITAVKPGSAVITISAADGSGVKTSVQIRIEAYLRDISLESGNAVINVGEMVSLMVNPIPALATIQSVSYSSSDETVAIVSPEGIVTGIKNGMAIITVRAEDPFGKKAEKEIEMIVGTPVTDLSIDMSDCALLTGQKKQLRATVIPNTANRQKVTFESSNSDVATISDTGLITAVAPGTAEIAAITEDGGIRKSFQLTVNAVEVERTAVTQQELETALADGELQALTIENESEIEINIPEGNYSNVSLNIRAPKGHIENYGTFQSVVIESIGESTFVEHSSNNDIYYMAEKGTVQIAPEAVARVTLLDGVNQLKLVNDGAISDLIVNGKAELSISGSSESRIQMTATSAAEGARITTDRKLAVMADATLQMNLSQGAEDIMYTVSNTEQLPTVTGLGSVSVTILENGGLETVVGENTGEEHEQKVKVSGTVAANTTGVDGADIYLIPYSSEISADNIQTYLDRAVVTAKSGGNGSYLTEEVSIGNYYLFVQKDGYKDVLETLVLTSSSQEIYYAERIELVEAGAERKGNLRGTLYNAETGQPVAGGITLKIRSGRNNLSGDPLMIVLTAEDGTYEFTGLLAGQYTVQVLDERNDPEGAYITSNFFARVVEGENEVNSSITLALSSEQVRFILKWGDELSGASSDLDSHLIGPKALGAGQFHTWFSNMSYYDVNEEEQEILYANLDVDDTNWEGPETSTVYQPSGGIYHFYVHDYSNSGSEDSDQMSRSAAVVEVFVGKRQVAAYNVPNQPGTLWHVCDYDAASKQVIPVNAISYWTEELSYIGMDMLEYYRGKLADSINAVVKIRDGLTNPLEVENADSLISAAKNVLETSENQEEIREQEAILTEWADSCIDSVAITDITGQEIDSYSYTRSDIAKGSVELEISGYQESLPEFQVSLADGSRYEIMDSDRGGSQKMIVVTAANSYSCKYYINYVISNSMFNINSVTAGTEEELIEDWDTDWEYDEEGNEYRVLYVTGYSENLPENLVITPSYANMEVRIEASDKPGYEKMVVMRYLEQSRTYYIHYSITNSVCNIGKVEAQGEGGEELIKDWDTDWEYDEEDNEYRVLYVTGYSENLPENLVITPSYANTEVRIEASDRSGYEKMVVMRYLEQSRIYYIRYSITNSVCTVGKVEAQGEGEEELIEEWGTDWEYDEEDNEYRVLYVTGYSENLPENLVITPSYANAEVWIEASDRSGYEKMAVIRCLEQSWVYYIQYSISNEVCSIKNIKTIGEGGDQITGWIESDGSGGELEIWYSGNKPENVIIEPRHPNAEVRIETSDRVGYEKMAVITCFTQSRTYYILYTNVE